MRSEERCDRCNKFTMVGIDNGSALLFAHQWCKCSDERENAMSDNPRDIQFQGFAKMLTNELIAYLTSRSGLTLDEIEQEWNKIIARWAYDLVKHAFTDVDSLTIQFEEVLDMTELPKESNHE